jgi:2-polyprenyl-3-methyl-5-hydroxy-6-metoxy-1,4-benzoquinol methylase
MWEKEYRKRGFYWKLKPSEGLKEAIKYALKGIAVDIGAGEGRNSIFLAKNGFKVEAIDKNSYGLKKCKEFAKKYNLKISTKTRDITKFNFPYNKYSLVISIATIDFLKKSEIEKIVRKTKKSLIKNGVIYFEVFSKNDPLFKKFKKLKLKLVEKDTFYVPREKFYRHFFTKNEIKELFKDFKIIKLKEKRILDKSHNNPHLHNIIMLIAKNY